MRPRQQVLLTHALLQVSTVLLFLLSPSFASLGNNGSCQIEDYHGIEIQEQRIEGKWYVQAVSNSFFLQSPFDKCHTISFTFNTTQSGSVRDLTPPTTIQFQNIQLHQDNTTTTYLANGTFNQPGLLNLRFSSISEQLLSFEFVDFNDDFSVSILVGCNGSQYIGSSDVFILSRKVQETVLEIEKAMNEIVKLKFDTDIFTKDTKSCSWFE